MCDTRTSSPLLCVILYTSGRRPEKRARIQYCSDQTSNPMRTISALEVGHMLSTPWSPPSSSPSHPALCTVLQHAAFDTMRAARCTPHAWTLASTRRRTHHQARRCPLNGRRTSVYTTRHTHPAHCQPACIAHASHQKASLPASPFLDKSHSKHQVDYSGSPGSLPRLAASLERCSLGCRSGCRCDRHTPSWRNRSRTP